MSRRRSRGIRGLGCPEKNGGSRMISSNKTRLHRESANHTLPGGIQAFCRHLPIAAERSAENCETNFRPPRKICLHPGSANAIGINDGNAESATLDPLSPSAAVKNFAPFRNASKSHCQDLHLQQRHFTSLQWFCFHSDRNVCIEVSECRNVLS